MELSPRFKSLLEFALERLDERFFPSLKNLMNEEKEYLLLGTFLDPRFTAFMFVESEERELVVQHCIAACDDFISQQNIYCQKGETRSKI